jgi:hypothetical protein
MPVPFRISASLSIVAYFSSARLIRSRKSFISSANSG